MARFFVRPQNDKWIEITLKEEVVNSLLP